jgi:hypothetical protein
MSCRVTPVTLSPKDEYACNNHGREQPFTYGSLPGGPGFLLRLGEVGREVRR